MDVDNKLLAAMAAAGAVILAKLGDVVIAWWKKRGLDKAPKRITGTDIIVEGMTTLQDALEREIERHDEQIREQRKEVVKLVKSNDRLH